MAQIVKITSKGTASPALSRTSIKPSPLGKLIGGRIYQQPRLALNRIKSSGSVTVTNPRAATSLANQRTSSLGMGGVGQRGRNRDVGVTAKGELP